MHKITHELQARESAVKERDQIRCGSTHFNTYIPEIILQDSSHGIEACVRVHVRTHTLMHRPARASCNSSKHS